MNYYNEFDPFASAWLRNLIDAGAIPYGHVDARSITEVTPADLHGYDQCHFFAGIGGWSRALELAGVSPSTRLWTGSCPCQPFSAAGKRKGTDDERHLWPVWERLIAKCRPPVVFGEQVASADGRNWLASVRADLEALGYAAAGADLCAAGVGAPHIRQRLYFVGLADTDGTRSETIWGKGHGKGATARRQGDQWELGIGRIDGRLADTMFSGRSERGTESGDRQIAWSSGDSRLADTDGDGCQAGQGNDTAARYGDTAAAEGCHGRLADADGRNARAEREQRGGEQRFLSEDGGACRMADTDDTGPQGRQLLSERAGERPAGESSLEHGGRPGTADSFWGTADWLFCRDGKWRPVEPGTFPLAHGLPSRMGRLRGYGNAIVPQVAAVFIRAALNLP